VEAAHIFKLGSRYSDALGCIYLDRQGQKQPVIMGSYGMGIGRLAACIVEEHHDQHGICWPVTVAPFEVHLVSLAGSRADELYTELQQAGYQVLYDDRDQRPGVKFKDADLIGVPLRITMGERSLKQGGVELKVRAEEDNQLVPLDQLSARLAAELERLKRSLAPGLS